MFKTANPALQYSETWEEVHAKYLLAINVSLYEYICPSTIPTSEVK